MADASKKLKKGIAVSFVAVALFCLMGFVFCAQSVFAEEAPAPAGTAVSQDTATMSINAEKTKFALIAAAITFGFGAIGAGIAVGNVGAAAMGAIGEKPEIAGQALIFVALGEGLMIFGFILAILILGRG